MSDVVIRVEDVWKQYRIGVGGTGMLGDDLKKIWYKARGRNINFEDKVEENDRSIKGNSELVWALQGVNFEVKRGEVLGIVGKNGAGKSTLLKILSRVTKPTKGELKIKGRIASLLEVGTGFHPDLTGRENIFTNGAILGMKQAEIKRHLDEIIAFSGVERYIDTPVKRYSSGMYVRLAFAVAAHLDPEILILDEVLAVGDAEFQKKCLGKMQDVSQKEGRTVLFVSHNMQAISTLTDKCIILKNGKKTFDGATPDAIKDYLLSGNPNEKIYLDKPSDTEPKIIRFQLNTSLPDNVQVNCEKMEIEIEIHTPVGLQGAAVSFQIVNEYERAIVHSWNFDSDNAFGREPGVYILRCTYPTFRLYMGKYNFTVHFGEVATGKKLQLLEKICPFEVVMYGKKREYNWVHETCMYIEDSSWTVKKIK